MEIDALRIAGAFGDSSLHTTLAEKLTATSDRATRARILVGLSAFRDPALVKATLTLLQTSSVDPREFLRPMLREPMEWPVPREIVFEEVAHNFDRFASYLADRSVGYLFVVGASFCDARHRAEVQAAFGPLAEKVLGGKRDLAQALEAVDLCIAEKAVQESSISRYLAHAKH